MNKHKSPKPTIEDHINRAESRELINILRERIKELDGNIYEYATQPYIGYKLAASGKLFVEVHIQKKKIELHLRPLNYLSSKLSIRKVPDSHKWTLNRLVDIINEDDLNYAMVLIKESYTEILSLP